MKAFARREIGWTAENIRYPLTQSYQLDEAEAVRIIVNEEIHVAPVGRFVARC